MAQRYVMIDLDDEKIADLADVLGNKTCKKVLEYLADKEASETEIARDLKMPANTVNYNVKKLVRSGFVEKSKNFFWSVKGKKIIQYKLSNKKVVISPRSSGNTKGILGAFFATAVGALVIKLYSNSMSFATSNDKTTFYEEGVRVGETATESVMVDSAPAVVDGVSNAVSSGVQMPELGLIFLAGGLFALIIFMILNYRRL